MGIIIRNVCAAVLAAAALTACQPAPSSAGRGTPDSKIVIGFAMDSLVVERWLRDRDAFMSRARELGADVILQVANEDPEVQARQIAWLASQDIDCLVVVPNDSARIAGPIREAKARGIPVVAYDRLAEKAGVDLFVSFDNLKIGRLIAEPLLDRLPRGRIMIINGSKRDNNAHRYRQGIQEALRERLKSGAYRLSGEVWLENWSNEEATRAVEAALDSPDIITGAGYPQAILCANDFLAEAVIGVLAEHRIAGQVLVTGHDAELSACQRVVEGTQLATVYKPIPQLAARCAELAVELARGKRPPVTGTIDDGAGPVPVVYMDAVAVTRDNMLETVVQDGFHREGDIYRRVPAPPAR